MTRAWMDTAKDPRHTLRSEAIERQEFEETAWEMSKDVRKGTETELGNAEVVDLTKGCLPTGEGGLHGGPSMLPLLLPLIRGGGGGGATPGFRAGISWLEPGLLDKELAALLRVDALRCGGRGGGEGFAPTGLGEFDAAVAPLLVSVATGCCSAPWEKPEAFIVGLAETTGKGKAEDTALLEMEPERDGEFRWPAGLLGGGGVGTAVLTRMLDDRDMFESRDERGGVPASSYVSGCDLLLSVLAWDCLLGGGAGFLGVDAGFSRGVEGVCDVFGGVGGLGDGMTSASGSMSSSGTLPADSLSKMLSLGSSSDLTGGGGRGLLTPAGLTEDLCPGDIGDAPVSPPDIRRSSAAGLSLSFNSTLINLPCLVAGGGGGGFLRADGFD
ncbi:hypothetical protein VP1G_08435 [Cytospora mali]|uniref:Uncharacterized protein n=1 Tax=Cytospora mali TaxID=578113 RepID=A0A194VBS4_CYTMA|nr:hypothetical protein VP1G_08435 [Valsa mali var. pyri (nom. inval.)]